jgi:hypothetical protein
MPYRDHKITSNILGDITSNILGDTTLTYSSSITANMNTYSIFKLTVTGDTTISAAGGSIGNSSTFIITGDATGGRVVTWGAGFYPGLDNLVVGAASVVVQEFVYDGINWKPSNINNVIYAGLYNRERSDKWAIKGYTVAADRYTLQSPTQLAVYINRNLHTIVTKTNYDLSLEATWDSIVVDYRVAASRAGKDFFIYACETGGNTLKVVVSLNNTAPTGYTTTTSRCIGGFHCLCLSVGTIAGHTLTGFLTGDILPNSVWDYNHRPISSPSGMVYSPMTNLWVDIYLTSGTGTSTASVMSGVISDNRDWMSFVDDGGAVSKRLLWDTEFQLIATGSNEETNITGSAEPVTTGGHVDTAGRRMIANNGCEDCCGVTWQWLLDQSYRYDGGSHSHTVPINYLAAPSGSAVYKANGQAYFNAVTGSAGNETVTTSSVDPSPAWAFYNLAGAKGSAYIQGTYGDIKLLAGAYWYNSTASGSRSRYARYYRWYTDTDIGGRLVSEAAIR